MNDAKKQKRPLTHADVSGELFKRCERGVHRTETKVRPRTPADLLPNTVRRVEMPVDRESVIQHIQNST